MKEAEDESWEEMKALADADGHAVAQADVETPVPAHPAPSMDSSNLTKSPSGSSDVQVVEGDSQLMNESLPTTPGSAGALHGQSHGVGSQQDQIMHLLTIVKMKMPFV